MRVAAAEALAADVQVPVFAGQDAGAISGQLTLAVQPFHRLVLVIVAVGRPSAIGGTELAGGGGTNAAPEMVSARMAAPGTPTP